MNRDMKNKKIECQLSKLNALASLATDEVEQATATAQSAQKSW